jgi:deoxyribose-phosphate aldolase
MTKIIEYGYYDLASNETEIKENIKQATEYKPKTISVLPFYTKVIKPLLPDSIKLSTVIDYPFGISDSLSRIISIEQAIKDGSDSIELIMQSPFLCNRKYDKIRKELEAFSSICQEHKIKPKVILEYKIFAPELLYKSCSLLSEFGIDTIYPSANFLMDNISDNIIAGMLILKKNPNIMVIFNGNAWTDSQVELILSNPQIHAYKTSNIYTLQKLYQKNQKK